MQLKDKINTLISGLGLSSSRFADLIGVTRPIISHILTGRNKPSLEIIQKIVSKFPELGYAWIADNEEISNELISEIANSRNFMSLFGNNHSSRELNENNLIDHQSEILNSQGDKKIDRIVVFYTDGTFGNFTNN
jgi:transcriptional regulator with XRE-family HTH domain